MTTQPAAQKLSRGLLVLAVYKLAAGVIEVLSGCFLLLSSTMFRLASPAALLINFAQGELAEDPHDFIATWLMSQNPALWKSLAMDVGIFFLVFGVFKLLLATALLLRLVMLIRVLTYVLIATSAAMLIELILNFSFLKCLVLAIDVLIIVYLLRTFDHPALKK